MYELTRAQFLSVESFLEDLNTQKLVSQDQVISIESVLGLSLVTEKVNISRFTKLPSRTNFEHVQNTLTDVVKNVKITDLLTGTDLAVLAKDYVSAIRALKNVLAELQNIPASKLDMLLDEKYTSFYDSEVLVDLAETVPVFDVFKYHTDYVDRVWSGDSTSKYAFNSVMDHYADLMTSTPDRVESMPGILGTFLDPDKIYTSILRGNIYCRKPFTISDMCKVIKNIPYIITILEKLPTTIGIGMFANAYEISISKPEMSSSEPFVYNVPLLDEEQLIREEISYSTMKNIVSALTDPEALCLIRIFSYLKPR